MHQGLVHPLNSSSLHSWPLSSKVDPLALTSDPCAPFPLA
jgi:hypothetical protein